MSALTTKHMDMPQWLDRVDRVLKNRFLPFGLFVQLTGMLWLGSSGGYLTQTYIWCLLPGLLSLCIDIYRYGIKDCISGMTAGEKLLGILFIWILANPLFVSTGMDIGTVLNRVLKIVLYLYVVRTVVLRLQKPEKLLLIASSVATLFALITLIYQFGILGQPMGIRALGYLGYRVGSLGIGEFAELGNPILAALYYGCFASILCGYLATKQSSWQVKLLAIMGIIIIGLFILLSGARGPLMALIAMLGVATLLCQYPWKKTIIAILNFVVTLTLFWLHNDIMLQYHHVVADGFNGRFVNWKQAIDYIYDKPLFGHGAHAEYIGPLWRGVILEHPHNMLLNITYFWGIPAGLLFIAITTWSVMITLVYRHHLMIVIAGCCIIFGQVGMITDTYSFLVRPDLQWLMFFFPVMLCTFKKRAQ